MRISTKGFKEAAVRFALLADAPQKQLKFREALATSLEPIRDAAAANVHSITGRTVEALQISPGRSETNPSAYLKVDKRIAYVLSKGRPLPYPYVVEAGHGGKHPAAAYPWFRRGFETGRTATRRLVRDGIEEFLNPYMTNLSIGGEFQ